MRAHNIAGMKFGRLTVIERDAEWKKKDARWICKCDCGNFKSIVALSLKNGTTKSCGCAIAELARKRATTHGMTRTREHRSWGSMIQRCENPNHIAFHNYGGRGIKVSPDWRNSFQQFLLDMGPRPANCTLDRIDVNGDYEPKNCRWANEKEQKSNLRHNHIVEWDGESYTLSNLAEKFGLSYNVLSKRLKAGTPLAESLHRPIRIINRYQLPASKTSS